MSTSVSYINNKNISEKSVLDGFDRGKMITWATSEQASDFYFGDTDENPLYHPTNQFISISWYTSASGTASVTFHNEYNRTIIYGFIEFKEASIGGIGIILSPNETDTRPLYCNRGYIIWATGVGS